MSIGFLRHDVQEVLVQLLIVVEDGLADLFGIPGDRLPIRIPGVISAEDLVPVAGGIEEIDRLPARNAVPRGPDVDRDLMHAHDVRSTQDFFPTVEQERRVMKFIRFRVIHERDIVRLVRAR